MKIGFCLTVIKFTILTNSHRHPAIIIKKRLVKKTEFTNNPKSMITANTIAVNVLVLNVFKFNATFLFFNLMYYFFLISCIQQNLSSIKYQSLRKDYQGCDLIIIVFLWHLFLAHLVTYTCLEN